jgi:hypothetical protein
LRKDNEQLRKENAQLRAELEVARRHTVKIDTGEAHSTDQQAQRLRALFKSGEDKLLSFYTVLGEVRQEIGYKELPNWCLRKLGIGFSVIEKISGVLAKTQEERVKIELRTAREAAERAACERR